MNWIEGYCRTNLDYYDCNEVKVFAAMPTKGDYVTVRYKGNYSALRIVAITHRVKNGNAPYIEVELNN